ncbi:MAG: hypothetical protein A2Y55_10650 [Actinobacteria bacterium RBG_16_68_12]|nr:MAG: hypothetical protein A2Y55_10650 [Actinobacteria bacterium RBG_16_68_12]
MVANPPPPTTFLPAGQEAVTACELFELQQDEAVTRSSPVRPAGPCGPGSPLSPLSPLGPGGPALPVAPLSFSRSVGAKSSSRRDLSLTLGEVTAPFFRWMVPTLLRGSTTAA